MNVTFGKTADLATILCLVFLKIFRAEKLKQRISQSIRESDHKLVTISKVLPQYSVRAVCL